MSQLYTHIAGVISVYNGTSTKDTIPFIHISYDDMNITFSKILELYISISKGMGDNTMYLYTNEEENEELNNLIQQLIKKHNDYNIIKESIPEYTNHVPVTNVNNELVVYLAHGDEVGQRSQTKEGLSIELSNTKSAMINLLEDAYEAQDKILMQSESLSKALEESTTFAKKAEEERANYLLLLSSVGEGIIVLDKEGNIDIANNAILSLLRVKKEEIYRKKIREVFTIKDREGAELSEELIKTILATEEVMKLPPLTVIRTDGTTIIVSVVASPVMNKLSEERVGIILTIRDIGEELALEEARINFISTASHQLRTPLTSMRWFVEMLYNGEAGTITDEQHQYVEQINQGINRMVSLVNYLLRTARVESNRTKIQPEPIKINSILEDCISKIRDDLKKKNQTVKINSIDLPEIQLDREYVSEVFINIIKNANLYGKDGDEIIINETQEDNQIKISITDHGIGIEEDDKPRVFAKFFRSEKAIISSPDGTGLGLSFVNLLVNEWGGKITFESKPNVETTFSVTIPFAGMKERKGEVRLNE